MSQQDLAYLLETIASDKWQRLGISRRMGVVVPLFSLYSRQSTGIGELSDLKLLIDWCVQSGNSVIQLLPLNDLGPSFCPYDALSSFALEPAYLSFDGLAQEGVFQEKIEALRRDFPAEKSPRDYGIKKKKLQLLWEIFEQSDHTCDSDFLAFRKAQAYWVEDYARFKVLKDYHQQKAWYEWPEGLRDARSEAVERFSSEHEQEIAFHIWLQWHMYRQFKEVRSYAITRSVLLKGDLPILVSRDSADAWAHPRYFKLGFASGAPPDMYCAKGQRWGMAPYNWERIALDGYAYLKQKLGYAQEFYDIFRIDHVVGLFRIWSIPYEEPEENKGLNGAYDPPDEKTWEEHGRRLLTLIMENTSMLVCAEDLGTIPPACTKALKDFGIPGNDVQRWTKDWKVRHDFLPASEYRQVSVAMLSTHDTTTWPAWWENEAGTVDEQLFIRKCRDRLDYAALKDKLFDSGLSRHGRLRWLKDVDSVDKLVKIMGRPQEELKDFVEMYENSYAEKEKLWALLGMEGPMQERCSSVLMQRIFRENLRSNAIFCFNTIVDVLYLDGIMQGDPYNHRINTPGTVGPHNWSWVMPLALEDLLKHRTSVRLKGMAEDADRLPDKKKR